jgi:hypothetical protein
MPQDSFIVVHCPDCDKPMTAPLVSNEWKLDEHGQLSRELTCARCYAIAAHAGLRDGTPLDEITWNVYQFFMGIVSATGLDKSSSDR